MAEDTSPLRRQRAQLTNGAVDVKYYYLNGQRVAEQRGGVWRWIHSDHLSSASVITDRTGAAIRWLAYAPCGAERRNSGPGAAPTYSYTGKERDAGSGLLYYGARYDDPALARFITPDTLYDRGSQGLNRYAYALNNPLRYLDPTGHFATPNEEDDPTGDGCVTGPIGNGGDDMVYHVNTQAAGYHTVASVSMQALDGLKSGPPPNASARDMLGQFLNAASLTPDDMLMEYLQAWADRGGNRLLSKAVFLGGMIFSIDDIASPNFWKKVKKKAPKAIPTFSQSTIDDVISSST